MAVAVGLRPLSGDSGSVSASGFDASGRGMALSEEVETALTVKHGEVAPFVRADLMQVRDTFPGIGVELRDFITDDGESQRWVALAGSLPIQYRGVVYNLPVAMYLVDAFPGAPPLCFVEPTADMAVVEKHPHVDYAGRVYLPYLNQWDAGQGSSLLGAAHAMVAVFQSHPPLYTKPADARTPTVSPMTRPASVNSMLNELPAAADPLQTVAETAATMNDGVERQLTQLIQNNLQLFTHEIGPDSEVARLHRQLQARLGLLEREKSRLEEAQAQLTHVNQDLDVGISEMTAWLAREEDGGSGAASASATAETGNDNNNSNDKERGGGVISAVEDGTAPDRPDTRATIDQLVVGADEKAELRLQLVAEDASLEDCLYHINQALYRGVIEHDAWQSEYRRLCEQQFMSRAKLTRVVSGQPFF